MMYHFIREEFTCKCGCGFDTMDYELLNILEEGRTYFQRIYGKVKTVVRGGNRCVKYNEKIQKRYNKNYIPFSSKSKHLQAKAADIKMYFFREEKWVQITPQEVHNFYTKKYPDSKGLGIYKNRNHIDSREEKARWRA